MIQSACWKVLRRPDAGAAAYRRVLGQAETVFRLDPNNAAYLNTLAAAYYRVGRHQEALSALRRCAERRKETSPAELAFLAMAQHQLGQKEQAQATLARLREAMKQPRWAKDTEAQGFLREAEAVLKTTPASGKSP